MMWSLAVSANCSKEMLCRTVEKKRMVSVWSLGPWSGEEMKETVGFQNNSFVRSLYAQNVVERKMKT